MSNDEIQTRIHQIITQELSIAGDDEIDAETNLITGGYLDSINAMRLVSQIEIQFGTKIPPRDLIPSNFLSIGAIASYLSSKAE